MLDEELLAYFLDERKKLESEVFTAPPRDWSDFSNRLGKWQQLADSVSFLEQRAEEQKE
jgi:hypothetical protein